MDTYEKKYRDLIEAVKELQGANPHDEGIQKWVEDNVPELAGSEDERIRKGLIQYFSTFRLGTFAGIEPKKIIAWLEQQKEYESTDFDYVWKATDCSELTSALDKYSEDAIKKVCHAWYDKGIELERKNCLVKQGEQKPAWSEEDEENLQNCIIAISRTILFKSYYQSNLIKWLKSLRQQTNWKPSDEQMNALDSTLQYSQVSHDSFGYLNSLFNDLKKLKL